MAQLSIFSGFSDLNYAIASLVPSLFTKLADGFMFRTLISLNEMINPQGGTLSSQSLMSLPRPGLGIEHTGAGLGDRDALWVKLCPPPQNLYVEVLPLGTLACDCIC